MQVFEHSRDITILIALATVVRMIVHYSSLFQYFFYWSNIVPTLIEIFLLTLSESEVCNYASLSTMFKRCYTAKQIKNCKKSTSVTKAATIKNTNGTVCPSRTLQLLCEKWSIHYASLSTIFNSLHSSINRDLVEKHLCNPSSYYEKYGWFLLHMQRKPSRVTTKLTLFTVSKMTGMHRRHEESIIRTAVCQQAHLRLKRRRTVEKLSL